MWKKLFLLLVLAAVGLSTYLLWFPWMSPPLKGSLTHTSLTQLREKQAKQKGLTLKTVLIWQPLDQISPHLTHAILLAEDDQFYNHQGFDFQQIRIAVETNWKKRKFAYGGSTITQQLARNLYLTPRKNLLRKAKEAVITFWLEKNLSKKRILELYMNVIEWGPGVYGAEAAARHYFEKSSADLTPDEAVALASIVPSPRRWNPHSERAFMARRRTNLLERMRRAGYIETDLLADEEDAPYPFETDISTDSLSGLTTESATIPLAPEPALPTPEEGAP